METTDNILAIKHNTKIEYLKFCVECGKLFVSGRSHTLACSDRCRQRIKRKKTANKPFLVQRLDISKEDLKRFKFNTSNVTVIKKTARN